MNHEIDSNIERLAGAGADLLVIRESVGQEVVRSRRRPPLA